MSSAGQGRIDVMSTPNPNPPTSLVEIIARLEEMAESRHYVSIAQVLECIGRRSFGPLILVPGLVVLSPVGGMPGVPTLVAVLIALTAGQLLLGRRYFWLPNWLLKRKAPQRHFTKVLAFMRPVARFTDGALRSRVRWLTGNVGARVVAFFCLIIALVMPPLEIIPFANSACGAALTAFGLS